MLTVSSISWDRPFAIKGSFVDLYMKCQGMQNYTTFHEVLNLVTLETDLLPMGDEVVEQKDVKWALTWTPHAG